MVARVYPPDIPNKAIRRPSILQETPQVPASFALLVETVRFLGRLRKKPYSFVAGPQSPLFEVADVWRDRNHHGHSAALPASNATKPMPILYIY